MKLKLKHLAPISAVVLLGFGSLYAVGAPAVTLTLNETITVSGAAPVDGNPPCTGTGAAVVCDNLRSAIAYANLNAVADTYTRIVLANGSTHTLTIAAGSLFAEDIDSVSGPDSYINANGDLDITKPVTIETTDNTLAKATIEGGAGLNDRLLHIDSTANLTNLILTKGQGVHMNGGAIYGSDNAVITIDRSVVTDNYASWDGNYGDPLLDNDGTNEVQGSGGGIYTKGPLTLTFSTVSKNVAASYNIADPLNPQDYEKNGNGGAIYSSQALTISDSTIGGDGVANDAINGGGLFLTGGTARTITRSTISHNTAVSGGAVNVVSPAAGTTITNSTISANFATDAGAGLNINGNITLNNVTVANNLLESSALGKGSGLNQFNAGVATVHNTLFSGNVRDSGGTPVVKNCGKVVDSTSTVASAGGNLSTDDSCNLIDGSDQQNVANAGIGALALNDNTYNGNLTHALLTGSPAINRGTAACPATDERNVARPQGTACDVGAYELIIPPSSGGGGGGCAMSAGKSPFDPSLPLLAAAGLIGLGLRRARRN